MVCLWCGRTVVRAVGRSVYGHVINKFSRMGRLLYLLTHGAPLACFARESSATKCFKIPTLKVRESFGNHYVLVLSLLDKSGLPNERACNAKLALSFTMWKKVRLHAFTFSNVTYGITRIACVRSICFFNRGS